MQRTTVKVTLEDGDHFTTTINLDFAGAQAYYRDFVMVTEDEGGTETKRRVIRVDPCFDDGDRVEILWNIYDAKTKRHESQWLPGRFVSYVSATDRPFRLTVIADNGWQAADAAPECVRAATA
jgi:hypothetical protein